MRLTCRWIVLASLICQLSAFAWAQAPVAPAGPATPPQYAPPPTVNGGTASTSPPVPTQAQPPQAPIVPPQFVLTAEQQGFLDQVLMIWEKESDKIQVFKSDFTLFEYDANWGPSDIPRRLCMGEVRYSKPDKGYYEIKKISNAVPDSQKKFVHQPSSEQGEKWICDGKAVYEFNATKKQVIERRLPPELMGKAISDGPLPFVFGVEAEKMKKRYWLKIVTPSNDQANTWILAAPKFRGDAANYQKIRIILRNQDLMPVAVEVYLPNNQDQKPVINAYVFEKPEANGALAQLGNFAGLFVRPQQPLGWQWIVDDPNAGQAQPAAAQQPPAGARPGGLGGLPLPFLPRK